jgi:hypothetical protein
MERGVAAARVTGVAAAMEKGAAAATEREVAAATEREVAAAMETGMAAARVKLGVGARSRGMQTGGGEETAEPSQREWAWK